MKKFLTTTNDLVSGAHVCIFTCSLRYHEIWDIFGPTKKQQQQKNFTWLRLVVGRNWRAKENNNDGSRDTILIIVSIWKWVEHSRIFTKRPQYKRSGEIFHFRKLIFECQVQWDIHLLPLYDFQLLHFIYKTSQFHFLWCSQCTFHDYY
jgi:hypothetical protein